MITTGGIDWPVSDAEVSFRAQIDSALVVLVAEHRYSPNSITSDIGYNTNTALHATVVNFGDYADIIITTPYRVLSPLTSLKTNFLKLGEIGRNWVTLLYTLVGVWGMGVVVVYCVLVVVVVTVVVVVGAGVVVSLVPLPETGAAVGGGGGVTTGGL